MKELEGRLSDTPSLMRRLPSCRLLLLARLATIPGNLTYDLAGNVTSQTYPAGSSRKVNYEYDSAGRLGSFTGTLGGSSTRTYADQFSYCAGGHMKQERFGTTTNLYHNLHYNSGLQLMDIHLGYWLVCTLRAKIALSTCSKITPPKTATPPAICNGRSACPSNN